MRSLNIDEKTLLPIKNLTINLKPDSKKPKISEFKNTKPIYDANNCFVIGLFNGSMELISYLIEFTQSEIKQSDEMSHRKITEI